MEVSALHRAASSGSVSLLRLPVWDLPVKSQNPTVPEPCPFSPQGNWDTSGSELSEGELEKQRRTLLEQLDEDQ